MSAMVLCFNSSHKVKKMGNCNTILKCSTSHRYGVDVSDVCVWLGKNFEWNNIYPLCILSDYDSPILKFIKGKSKVDFSCTVYTFQRNFSTLELYYYILHKDDEICKFKARKGDMNESLLGNYRGEILQKEKDFTNIMILRT